ncbi:MAG: hypothetical protein ACQEQJ_07375 [Halobacteriota archaeon]
MTVPPEDSPVPRAVGCGNPSPNVPSIVASGWRGECVVATIPGARFVVRAGGRETPRSCAWDADMVAFR